MYGFEIDYIYKNLCKSQKALEQAKAKPNVKAVEITAIEQRIMVEQSIYNILLKLESTALSKTSDNRCVMCGEIIPEGRQICPNCELKKFTEVSDESKTT